MKFFTNLLPFLVALLFTSCLDDSPNSDSSLDGDDLPINIENNVKSSEAASGPNLINLTAAKTLINNFVSNGSAGNFDFDGERITGYHFSRQELQDILEPGSSDSLFLIWCLDTNSADNSLYLNLIVAPVNDNSINQNLLARSFHSPTTAAEMIKTNYEGSPISYGNVHSYQDTFIVSGNSNNLMSANNEKVKGYTLNASDISALDIFSSTGNSTDIFTFIPVIRPVGSGTPPSPSFNHSYLSVAVGQISSQGTYMGNFREYLDPCPTTCLNYADLFGM